MEPVTFVLRKGKIVSRTWKTGLAFAAADEPGRFISQSEDAIALQQDGSLVKGDIANGSRSLVPQEEERCVAADPSDPRRVCVLRLDTARQIVTLTSPGGRALWEQRLPETSGTVGIRAATLGCGGSTAEGMTALVYSVRTRLVEYQAEVTAAKLCLFDRDGTILGEHGFPPNADARFFKPALVLDDIDGDGVIEIVVLEDTRVAVLEAPRAVAGREELDAAPAGFDGLPEYPLPPVDLWNDAFVDRAPTGPATPLGLDRAQEA
jgi:hypothetical protein